MQLHLIRSLMIAVCVATSLPLLAADDTPVSTSFKVTISSTMVSINLKSPVDIQAESEMRYTWRKTGAQRELLQDASKTRIVQNGTEKMNMTMSLAGITEIRDGKRTETQLADAPERVQKGFKVLYGEPICTLTVNQDGNEIHREMNPKEVVQAVVVKNGVVAGMTLFHPPFPANMKTWDAPASLTAGNGAFVTGPLHYEKVAGGTNGQAVHVSGTISCDEVKAPTTSVKITTTASAVVDGEEVYDTHLQEWISGKLNIELKITITPAGHPPQTMNGKMIATLEKVETAR